MRYEGISLAILILLLAAVLVNAGPIWVDHAALSPSGIAYEINRDAAGNLIVTDWGAGEIWRVEPGTSAYSRFSGSWAPGVPWAPNDARPDSAGNIWWTDYYSPSLARINTAANPVSMTTWNLSAWDPGRTYTLAGLAMDDSGKIWFSESDWDETSAGRLLYRFDPAGKQLCGYTLPGGDHSYYVLFHDGLLWLADWVLGRIVRVNPASLQVTYWPTGNKSEPRGLAADASGNIWWADKGTGKLGRLEPAANRITTYSLPVSAMPYMVAVEGSRIWYTAEELQADYAGNVGILDPAQVPGSSGTVNPVGPQTSVETCRSLGDGTAAAITTAPGTFSDKWSSTQWADVTPAGATGWTVFEPAWGGVPYGVLAGTEHVWVTDQTYQQLVRIPLGVVPTPTATPTRTPTSTRTATATPTNTPTPRTTRQYADHHADPDVHQHANANVHPYADPHTHQHANASPTRHQHADADQRTRRPTR